MAVRQYIGARYVTKIYENSLDPSSAEWQASVNYEPLTMVTYNNGSYLSRKTVPASVGDPASNPSYWAQTGFYNGQIAYLQSQIDAINSALLIVDEPLRETIYVMTSTGDSTDRSGDLAAALADNKTILFGAGVFHFAQPVTIPYHSILLGLGRVTQVISDIASGNLFTLDDGCIIENIIFQGTGAFGKPSSVGTSNAIYMTQTLTQNRCKIVNCDFQSFTGFGVGCENNGGDVFGSLNIVNCFFRFNGIGIFCGDNCEYSLINNCTIIYNHIGAQLNGGNNRLANSNIGANDVGVGIDGDNVTNAAHGQLVGCSINHNAVGIDVRNITNGEEVSACLFYRNTTNDIYAITVTGAFNIDSCQFGKDGNINIDTDAYAIFRNNTFYNLPLISGTARIKGFGNVLSDGSPIIALNRYMKAFSTYQPSTTYIANSYVTQSEFNKIVNYINGSELTICLGGCKVDSLPNTPDFFTIGQIDNVSLIADVAKYSVNVQGTVFVKITSTGLIQVLGTDVTPVTAKMWDIITIPLR